MGVAKQIIGSFEDIGKDIVRETVKAPTDILGKALESIGTSSVKKPQSQTQTPSQSSESSSQGGALGELDQTKDQNVKKTIARAALAQLAGGGAKQKEPSIWEKIQKETDDKKAWEKQQAAKASMSELPKMTSARRRGDLYGVQAKKQGSELGKNVRQD